MREQSGDEWRKKRRSTKERYNTWDSLVVTDPTTSQAIGSLAQDKIVET